LDSADADSTTSAAVADDGDAVKISKATVGAALVGGVVGAVMFGPISAAVLAGGAAYCTTRKGGRIGPAVRSVGNKAYSGAEKAVNWAAKSINQNR